MSSPQWVYLILTVVMGIPTVVYGGMMAVAGLVLALISMGEGIPGHWGGTVFLMSWAGAGVLGLLSWLWISWRYLRQGATGLRRVGTIAWSGLAAGMAAAILLAWMIFDVIRDGDVIDIATLLFTGPGLLPPAIWLCWQRLRAVAE